MDRRRMYTARRLVSGTHTLGVRRVMFAVDDIEEVIARRRAHGAALVRDIDVRAPGFRVVTVMA
ncbi:hypothetical protein ABZZ44_10715 [Streptomyces sp. NPDC006460]|uniref:hypothetical protein n=1 Tax=Streptomyces sp. NPDC006460 TaxID=3154304 RepID=UPI0033A608BE